MGPGWRQVMGRPMRQIGAGTQAAVLLVFPEGYSAETAGTMMELLLDQARAGIRPEIVEVKEFRPGHGGVTIYQP